MKRLMLQGMIIFYTSCATFGGDESFENDLKIMPPPMAPAMEMKPLEPDEMSAIVLSLRTEVLTLKKEMEEIRVALRTGILLTDSKNSFEENKNSKSQIFEYPKEKDLNTFPSDIQKDSFMMRAKDLMSYGQYGEAIVILSEALSADLSYKDDGESLYLLAKCWISLEQPLQAHRVLKQFYSKFPQSSFKNKARLLEAEGFLIQNMKNQALALYREIIALAPSSQESDAARAQVEKLRNMP